MIIRKHTLFGGNVYIERCTPLEIIVIDLQTLSKYNTVTIVLLFCNRLEVNGIESDV